MVETIAPVVHGGRRRRYWAAVTAHVAGTTASAAAFGAAAGAAGHLLGAPWGAVGPALVAAAAALYALRELAGAPVPVPDRHKQVPDWWRTFYSPPVASLLYGLGLGIGFLTFLGYGTYVAVTVGAFATGDPAVGSLVAGTFGLVRGASVTVSAPAGDEEGAARVVDRLERLAATPVPKSANGLVLVAVAATAGAALL